VEHENDIAEERIGQELRQFFLDLLQEVNLREYHDDREQYIARKVKSGLIGERTSALLLKGTLAQIEENIMLVTGSHKAVPIWVVSPPY